ncbi:hypothetical protein M9H77_02910 [Catharanthus roseus]|uniref:Uncharacterized protein n=1 Tax=Catharanthus roseus TaxID=4058 RepID=A0ACC0C9Q4_CATRO|nr:hypothetical protein M9H77_02910 [Catharanthus roseus]
MDENDENGADGISEADLPLKVSQPTTNGRSRGHKCFQGRKLLVTVLFIPIACRGGRCVDTGRGRSVNSNASTPSSVENIEKMKNKSENGENEATDTKKGEYRRRENNFRFREEELAANFGKKNPLYSSSIRMESIILQVILDPRVKFDYLKWVIEKMYPMNLNFVDKISPSALATAICN